MKIKINQKGAVIPLIAISLIMIMSMLTLVVDFGALTMAKSDMRDTAQAASVAALKSYAEDLNTRIALRDPALPPLEAGAADDIYREALNTAIQKASAVANLNLMVSTSSSFRGDPNSQIEEKVEDFSTLGSQASNTPSGSLSGGYIQPGRWHFVESATAGPPPCLPPGEDFRPCFEVLDDNVAANAMRVVLTDEGGAVRRFFGAAAGIPMSSVSGAGTAAYIPRQGVVAFDLSVSTTRDTHLAFENPLLGKKSEYAYYIDPNEEEPSSAPNPSPASCPAGSLLLKAHLDTYNDMEPDSNLADPSRTKENFKNNYECIAIDVKEDDETATEHFLIETGPNAEVEPLNSILQGTNFLLQSFADRRVVGDKVGAFGFDYNVLPQRRLPENRIGDALTGLLLAEPVDTEPEFEAYLAATDTSVPITEDSRKDRFLFPRALVGSPNGTTRKAAYTKLQTALDESMEMLKSSNTFEISDNFILLITDGITNCVNNTVETPIMSNGEIVECYNSDKSERWGRNLSYITAGFDEIFKDEGGGNISGQTESIASDGVRVHVALIGEFVGAHSLVRKGSSSGCSTFDESIAGGLEVVDTRRDPSDPLNRPYHPDTGGFFIYPNNFANVAAATGGIWWPILKKCSDENFTLDDLNQICEEQANDDVIPLSAVSGFSLTANDWDEQGRLLCDPSGRTVEDQLEELVTRIMSDSPIILVE